VPPEDDDRRGRLQRLVYDEVGADSLKEWHVDQQDQAEQERRTDDY
jgi:hypothetical protein